MFELGMLTLKEDSKKKKFYDAYGKHVLLIEFVLILALTFAVAVLLLFPSFVVFLAWFISAFVCVVVHFSIFVRIAKMELYPYEILRLEHVRFNFFKTIGFIFFPLLALFYLKALLFAEPLEMYILILAYALIFVFPMFIISVMLNFSSISHYRRTRLSLKTVLDGLELLNNEEIANGKMKLVKKYVKWFRVGLRSFNSYLYERNPTHLKIVDVDQYHQSVCSVVLMGKRKETDAIIEQIRFALNCLGEKKREYDLRHFLIALKNVKSGKRRKEYPLSELNEMISILPFTERVKERLKSPYVTSLIVLIIGIIAIVLQALSMIWK